MTAGFLNRLRKLTPARAALMTALLFVVGVQDYVAQTHVHARAESFPAQTSTTLALSDQGKHAPREGRDNCALCQIVLHGSAPLPRTAVLLVAPAVSVFLVLAARPRVAYLSAVSHSWQGRGPPSI